MGESTDLLICKCEEDQREHLRSQPKEELVKTIMTLYEQLDNAEGQVRALELENVILREERKRAKSSEQERADASAADQTAAKAER